jgi:biopolymer transport protein ExbD
MAHKRKTDGGLDLDLGIVITPMLDMAFQLLAFFILTFHPSDLEGALDLNLPLEGETMAEKEPDPTNSDTALEKRPAEVEVIVMADSKEGGIAQITVKVTRRVDPTGEGIIGGKGQTSEGKGQNIEGENEADRLTQLRKHLEGAYHQVENKEDIKLQADENLRQAYTVKVMDMCTQAGFQRVSFGPPLPHDPTK